MITYDFKKLPATKDAGTESDVRLYPVAVKQRMVKLSDMAEDISMACSLSAPDVKAAIPAIADALVRYLNAGCHVELDGFGTFSLSLACRKEKDQPVPVITSPDDVRPSQLCVSRVRFDAKAEVMNRLTGPFKRTDTPIPSRREATMSAAEREALLMVHLDRCHGITISNYMTLTGLTRRHANEELTAFVNSGKLICQGTPPHLFFVKNVKTK